MGLILAGILSGALFLGLMFVLMSRSRSPNATVCTVLTVFAVAGIMGGIVSGIMEPVSGYGEPQMVSSEEVELPYTSSFEKEYESNKISNSNVTIVKDDSYTDAKLVTYVRYGKKSFWTFAVGAKQYEYVLYVPTGTIE